MIRWFKCSKCLALYSRIYGSYSSDDPKFCHFCGSKKIKRLYKKEFSQYCKGGD